MNYLIFCPCSHALDRHGDRGCGGDGRATCTCPLTPTEALNEALTAVKSTFRPAESDDGQAFATWRGSRSWNDPN